MTTVHQYAAVFEEAPEGGYTVTVPALPGCVSEGDTFEEASDNIREAAELYIEVSKENKNNIPYTSRVIVAPVSVEV